jgi:hypothetical protein
MPAAMTVTGSTASCKQTAKPVMMVATMRWWAKRCGVIWVNTRRN